MTNSSAPSQRFAICIGINAHPLNTHAPVLLHAEEDAQAFYSLLDYLDVPQANRELLLGSQVTLEAITSILDKLLRKKPGRKDLVIFYYAGYIIPLLKHVMSGTAVARLDVLLATNDLDKYMANIHDPAYPLPLLGIHRLRDEFIDDSLAGHLLFVLDCYSISSSMADQHPVPEDVQWMAERMSQLVQHNLPGHFALTSCMPAQRVLDTVADEQRLSSYILKVLRGEVSEALRKDQALTLEGLCQYVSEQFLLLNQHYNLSDDFVIAHYPLLRTVKTAPLHSDIGMTFEIGKEIVEGQASQKRKGPDVVDTNLPPQMEEQLYKDQKILPIIKNAETIESTVKAKDDFDGKIDVFVCYHDKDNKRYEELKTHLPKKCGSGRQIKYWDQIESGLNVQEETKKAILSARLAIILSSVDLINSASDGNDKLSLLLKHAENGKVTLIPVLNRPSLLDDTKLGELQFINKDKPLDKMKPAEREEIYVKVAKEVKERLKEDSPPFSGKL